MKKIAFIAHGPGTANALFPLIEPLKKDYSVSLFAFHPYAAKLWGTELSLVEEFPVIFTQPFDLIISGTGSMHEVENQTPVLAREANIPVVSILDLWGNYTERYENEPDYIICLDDESKIDIVYQGISPSKVFTFGNPHFDRLQAFIGFYPIKPPYRVSFFSQPLTRSKETLYQLLLLKDAYPGLIEHIYVTAHPREDDTWLRQAIEHEPDVTFQSNEHSFDLVVDTDVSVGVHSTLLHEAEMIGKAAVFYKSPAQLKKTFHSLHERKQLFKVSDFKATERCLAWINQFLSK